MSDTSWALQGLDPEVRAQAEEDAARLGVSLADYLAEILLHQTLRDQVASAQATDHAEEIVVSAPHMLPPADTGFSPRHRIEAIERRLGLATGSFESAVQALDASLVELAARVDETETVAGEISDALAHTVHEIAANLTALRKRLADAEDLTEIQGEQHDAAYDMFAGRCDRLDERLQVVDVVARGAEQAVADLAAAQEALKYAVAEDFSELARESADRLSTGLDEVRTAADAAAAQADAAVTHLVSELRGLRTTLEQRMTESAAETRNRMQAAFAETGERLTGLADRLTVVERFAERSTEQLRVQLTDVEDGAQTALEETADALRQAGAALAAEFARATQDNRVALESIHADLSSEIAELRERQAGEGARIKLIDTAVSNTASEISAVRQLVGSAMGDISAVRDGLTEAEASIAAVYENCDARFAEAGAASRERHAQLQAEVNTRFADALAQEDERQRKADEALAVFCLETERIEACTLAALEQLNQNIAAGDATLATTLNARLDNVAAGAEALDAKLEKRLAHAKQSTDTLIAEITQRLEGQIAELRDNHSGAVAHLSLIDRTLDGQDVGSAVEQAISPVREQLIRLEREVSQRPFDPTIAARLDQLETAASRTETQQALAVLQNQVDAMALQVSSMRIDAGVVQRVEDLRARLGGVEAKSGENADRVQGVARLLGRVTAQSTDAAKQSDERLHKIEMALADLRLERLSVDNSGPTAMQAVADIGERMAAMEEQQAATLSALQGEIAAFIGESERRLAAVEGGAPSDPNLGRSFEALRVSVEERILGIELRSVRTLEQVADTVALLEERLIGQEAALDEAASKAAG